MHIIETELPGVVIIEPLVFEDGRGFFMETYQKKNFEKVGIGPFVQDNFSFSQQNTLRGLHYQHPHSQAKLVQVFQGAVFDVAVDIRQGSPAFGKWIGMELSDKNRRQMYIPAGFAHGFLVLSKTAVFVYKCSDYYSPGNEGGILFSDPDINIKWPGKGLIFSRKDRNSPRLRDISPEKLPEYRNEK